MNSTPATSRPPSPRRVVVLGLLTFVVVSLAVSLVVTDHRMHELRLLNSAYSIIHRHALHAPGADSLLIAAADGMTSILDPYSEYLPSQRWETVRESTDGLYHGIGIEMVIYDGVVTVVAPIQGSPAHRAGLRPGDRIVEIDSVSARGITAREAAARLRGAAGTKVVIRVERAGLEYLLTFELKRAEIAIQPISLTGLTPEGIGYIRLARFTPTAAEMLDSVLQDFLAHGSTGWILDLRGNPGGYLDQAVEVAGCFLPEDALVCRTQGRRRLASFSLFNEKKPVSTDIPLVILIDRGSASASEIVAAAIADHRRGVIVGRRSFGKGLVQSLSPLDKANALQLTTARYFTPGGYTFSRSWGEEGGDSIPENGSRILSGGFEPHLLVEENGDPAVEIELLQTGAFFNFVVSFSETDSTTSFDNLWHGFLADIRADEIEFVTRLEYTVAQAESVASQSLIASDWQEAFAKFHAPISVAHSAELAAALPRLKMRLAEAMVLSGSDHAPRFLPIYLSLDRDSKTALEVLRDPGRYESILGRTGEASGTPVGQQENGFEG